jgi:hypothetical protein
MVISVLHGITVDEAKLAISDSWSVLQKQDGIIECQVWYLPIGKIEKLTWYLDTDKNLSGQLEVRGSWYLSKPAPADFPQKQK